MKKILLLAVIAVLAASTFAQQTVKKVRIYKDNAVVYECNYADVDSIVFVDEIIHDVPDLPEGALSGEFSVSATKTVHFSSGNLQASTTDLGTNWTWGFAEHQWDFIGNAAANNAINGNGTVSANGIVDLFGWSTTATYYGISNDHSYTSHFGDFVDWGETIGEGWYTLSMDEWVYLFCGRTDAAHLFGMGSVNGINGTILLPDNWAGDKFTDTENGLTDRGTSYENIYGTNFSFHTYTAEQWATMETNGAVFLPAAGRCFRMDVSNVGSYGSYWSSTLSDEIDAWYMYFNVGILDPHGNNYREYGRSVRLVR